MKPEVAELLDVKAHFKAYDYREAQMREERLAKEKRDLAESKTQLGAVKRVMERIDSQSVGGDSIKPRWKT